LSAVSIFSMNTLHCCCWCCKPAVCCDKLWPCTATEEALHLSSCSQHYGI